MEEEAQEELVQGELQELMVGEEGLELAACH